MKHRLTQHKETDVTADQQQDQRKAHGQEFETAEEVLRADISQTEVPSSIRQRLLKEIGVQPKAKPWWRKWF